VARYDVLGEDVGLAGLLVLHGTSPELSICITFASGLQIGEPNIQCNHLDKLFNMVMSNLAFDNVYNGVILSPCFTILAYAPSSVVFCIFLAYSCKTSQTTKTCGIY
jgi:hypothetical protein